MIDFKKKRKKTRSCSIKKKVSPKNDKGLEKKKKRKQALDQERKIQEKTTAYIRQMTETIISG